MHPSFQHPDFPTGGNRFCQIFRDHRESWACHRLDREVPAKQQDDVKNVVERLKLCRDPGDRLSIQESQNSTTFNKPEHRLFGTIFRVGDKVMPVVTQHYLILQHNLICTAATRARKHCELLVWLCEITRSLTVKLHVSGG